MKGTAFLILLLPAAACLGAPQDTAVPATAPKPETAEGENPSGVTPFLNYTLDGVAVLRGGYSRGESLLGSAEFGVEVDLAQRWGWDGTRFHLHGLYLHGDDPTAELIGDANYASNIVGRGGARLFEAWADTQQGNWNFKAGLLAADSDFGLSETAMLFVNSSFGGMLTYSYNSGVPIWPLSGLGARVEGTLGEDGFFRVGAYDGLVADSHANRHGLHHRVAADEGVFAIGEVGSGWKTNGRAGQWTLGLWWHSGTFADYRDGSEVKRNYGYHLIVEESLSTDGRWKGFARVGYAPRGSCSYVRLHGDVGISATGVFAGRPRDTLGVGVFSTRFSDEYLASRRSAGDEVTSRESGIEVTYSFALGPRVWLQPDFQYILSPHESGSDAALALLRLYVEL